MAAPAPAPAPAAAPFVIDATNLEPTNLYTVLMQNNQLTLWESELVKRNINPDVYRALVYYWKFAAMDNATGNPVTDTRIEDFNQSFLTAPDSTARLALLRGDPDMFDDAVVLKAIQMAYTERGGGNQGSLALRSTQRNTWKAEYDSVYAQDFDTIGLPAWAKAAMNVPPGNFDPLSSAADYANPQARAHYIRLYVPDVTATPGFIPSMLDSHIYLGALQQVFASTSLHISAPTLEDEGVDGITQTSFVGMLKWATRGAVPPPPATRGAELLDRLTQLRSKLALKRADLARAGTNALPILRTQRYLGTDVANYTAGSQVANVPYSTEPYETGEINLDEASDLMFASWGNGFGKHTADWPEPIRNEVRDLYVERVRFVVSSWLAEKLYKLNVALETFDLVAADAPPAGANPLEQQAWQRARTNIDRLRMHLATNVLRDCQRALAETRANFLHWIEIGKLPLSPRARDLLNRSYIQAYISVQSSLFSGQQPADFYIQRESLLGSIVDTINTENSWKLSVDDWLKESRALESTFAAVGLAYTASDFASALLDRAKIRHYDEKKREDTGVVIGFDETLHELVHNSLDANLARVISPTVDDKSTKAAMVALLTSVAVADYVRNNLIVNGALERSAALFGVDNLYELFIAPSGRESSILEEFYEDPEVLRTSMETMARRLPIPLDFTLTAADVTAAYDFVRAKFVSVIASQDTSLVKKGDLMEFLENNIEQSSAFLRHHGWLGREKDFIERTQLGSPALAEKVILYEIQETKHKIAIERSRLTHLGNAAALYAEGETIPSQVITMDEFVAAETPVTLKILVTRLHPLLKTLTTTLTTVDNDEVITQDSVDLTDSPEYVFLRVTLTPPIITSDLVLTTTATTPGRLPREAQKIHIRIVVNARCVRCSATFLLPGPQSLQRKIMPVKTECVWKYNPLAMKALRDLENSEHDIVMDFSLHEAIVVWYNSNKLSADSLSTVPEVARRVLELTNIHTVDDISDAETFAEACKLHYPLPRLLTDMNKDIGKKITTTDPDASALLHKYGYTITKLCSTLLIQYRTHKGELARAMNIKFSKIDEVATLQRLQGARYIMDFDWDSRGATAVAARRATIKKQAKEETLYTYMGKHSSTNVLPDCTAITVTEGIADEVITFLQNHRGDPDLTWTQVFKNIRPSNLIKTQDGFAVRVGSKSLENGAQLDSLGQAVKTVVEELRKDVASLRARELTTLLQKVDEAIQKYNEVLFGSQRYAAVESEKPISSVVRPGESGFASFLIC